ncbi:MAG: hypothetical protein ACE5I1_11145 [bacterium]
MSNSREQNEKKFSHWDELSGGGRQYWYEVAGRRGWKARYVKEVDKNEAPVRYYQKVYDAQNKLIESHVRFPKR